MVSAPGVVTGRYGTIGEVFFVTEDYWPLNTTLFVKDFKGNDPLFVSLLLRTIDFSAHSGKSGVPGVNRNDLHQERIVRPTLTDQQAIAAVLSDVDALLAKLDQLITKKSDLKLAAMQQLLTGRVRLPGFTGEWSLKCLGDISEISMGRTPSRLNPLFWGPGSVWLSIADMKCKVLSESKEEITALATEGMSLVQAGTLLMSFKLSIGRLAFAGCDLYTNEAICGFSLLQANAEFLYYALQRTDFSLYGKQAVKGYTLNKQSLKLVEVKLPEPEEQEAIASILSDMDAELAALEARRAKTRELKQGMMQALLTGRIRLT
jgi:type I restriction enzyme S subunit